MTSNGRLPRYLTLEQVSALYAVATGPDLLMLDLAYSSGARVGELCALTWGDVDLGNEPSVRLQGKGGDERLVPLGIPCAEALRAARDGHRPDERILPYTPDQARRRFRALGRKIGLKRWVDEDGRGHAGLTPHMLRHSFCTHLMQNHPRQGEVLEAIRQMAGHRSIATLQPYLGLDHAEQAQLIQDCMARARGQISREHLRRGLDGRLHWR